MKRVILLALLFIPLGCGGGSGPTMNTDTGQDVLIDGMDAVDGNVGTDTGNEGITEGTTEGITEGVNEGTTEGVTEGVSEDVNEGITEETVECNGEPGCACTTDGDCNSGVCMEADDGVKRCAAPCDNGNCKEGYTCQSIDGTDICVWTGAGLCRPCKKDADCVMFTGDSRLTCAVVGNGKFCVSACTTDTDCMGGYGCSDGLCKPARNECECSQASITDNASGTCMITNTFGTCEGTWTCTADGFSDCSAKTPEDEIPDNGIDDNCNGLTDEGSTGCQDYYKDADKDGFGTDEKACLKTPQEDFSATKSGDCDDTDPNVNPDATEVCDGVDNNCDNAVDNDPAVPQGVTCPDAGVCKDSGVKPTCVNAKWVCDFSSVSDYSTTDADCDCKDNDCDGSVDEERACAILYGDMDGDGLNNSCDPDIDGDGVANEIDDCPALYDPNQDGNCPGDKDSDGVADPDDNCPDTYNPDQSDIDSDSIGDACDDDMDGDGVTNDKDCRPRDPSVNPNATEICNGIDDNCDNVVDEGCGQTGLSLITGSAFISTDAMEIVVGQGCVAGSAPAPNGYHIDLGFIPSTR